MKNDDKPKMLDYWRERFGYNNKSYTNNDNGLAFINSLMIPGAGGGAISCAVALNALACGWHWQPSTFLAVFFWTMFSLPYVLFKLNTHVPRGIRKAEQKALEQENEIRALRIREAELGLPEWELGK